MSGGLHDIGVPRWELALCLLLSWIVIVVCMVRGVQSAGKAVYFTALFPYIVLTILFVRGLMLEGSLEGLKYYFIPKWELLMSSKVMVDFLLEKLPQFLARLIIRTCRFGERLPSRSSFL